MSAIYKLAKQDPRVVFIGSDLGAGVLKEMKTEFPERFFMEGVSEAHIIGMAAGLATQGFIPYFNTIATFITRRCFEQVAIDLCLHNLPVRLLGSGGGAVYAPLGPTHMALDDIAIMRALPNMTIIAPADAPEMGRAMEATLDWAGPVYIRIAKGGDPIISQGSNGFAIGKAIVMRKPAEIVFISTGIMTNAALLAADLLQADGLSSGVIHLHTIKPLDETAILAHIAAARMVVTVEEHSRIGGLGSAVAEVFVDAGVTLPLLRLAMPDAYMSNYGSQAHILATAGLTPPQIASAVRTWRMHKMERPDFARATR